MVMTAAGMAVVLLTLGLLFGRDFIIDPNQAKAVQTTQQAGIPAGALPGPQP